jgi:hypothetical protein
MLSYGYYENINGKLRGRVTEGNIKYEIYKRWSYWNFGSCGFALLLL